MTSAATERRITAGDIAREVGVSRATVGFVLNSTPGQTISEGTRDKVLDAARRLGYRPHLAAKALASGRSRIILLVLPDWPIDYSMRRHLDEASTVLDQAGYSLVTMTPHPGGVARPLWETLQPDVVMGLLPFSAERYSQIRNAGVSAIIPTPESQQPAGELESNQGPRLQVEHLLEQGHRRFVFAAPTDSRLINLVTSRHAVAEDTARFHGTSELEYVEVDEDRVGNLVTSWHKAGVTAVIAYNDDIAALVTGAALRHGLAIPDDLAVIGHDDSPIARMFVPSLTTIHVDHKGLGRFVAQQALNAATGAPAPDWYTGPQVSLIEREST